MGKGIGNHQAIFETDLISIPITVAAELRPTECARRRGTNVIFFFIIEGYDALSAAMISATIQ